MSRDHRRGPGGPPGGATHPGGAPRPQGDVSSPLGWRTTKGGPPPLRLGINPKGRGGHHLPWGRGTPPWPPPPLADWICKGLAPPWPRIYMCGGWRGQPHLSPGASPPPVTPPNSFAGQPGEALLRYPLHPSSRRRAAGSLTTSPPPLLDQEGGDVAAPYVC